MQSDIGTIPGLEDLVEQPAEAGVPRLQSSDVTPQADAVREEPLRTAGDGRAFVRNGERPLRNPTQPQYENLREKYEHRIIAYLKAAGNSNVEVARLTGYSNVTINYLVRQPWMEQTILEEIHKLGDAAMQTLRNAAPEAAENLVELMRKATNDEVKRKACNDVLDRKYGKANQPYSFANKSADELSTEELMKIAAGKN